jgi:hypothetical protein
LSFDYGIKKEGLVDLFFKERAGGVAKSVLHGILQTLKG